MEASGSSVKVGDRVVISRPRSMSSFAESVERLSTVTAVRAKSFEAGGLCFRYDGREWSGHNRVRFVAPQEDKEHLEALLNAEREFQIERAERANEDAVLAFLLSSRDEQDWLRLGLHELRRIAALHGIASGRNGSKIVAPAPNPVNTALH